ncbi:hypothetical protein QBC43DRAFT_123641 [Cladorrhinum sp. PSN259]|nr:hypothetical protein QBC43DRAFT_123641 [Cladorrhinum sp. PSN259]
MDNTTVGACPEGGDSPLSWAGNLAGLLTFALGVFFTFATLLAATSNAEKEIEAKNKQLEQTCSHLDRLYESIHDLEKVADQDYDDLRNVIKPAVDAYRDAAIFLSGYMSFHFREPTYRRTHIKWWYMEKETAAGFANLQSCSQHLTAAQLTFVQRRVVKHSYELHVIQSKIGAQPM